MRVTIGLMVLLYSTDLLSQRVSFEDPELIFSFKKPKHWVIIDNEYVIKLSPSLRDTSFTYLTITYFAPPERINEETQSYFVLVDPETPAKSAFKSYMHSDDPVKILGFKVRPKRALITKKEIPLERRFYDFHRVDKNWEVVTSAPTHQYKKHHKEYKSILKSLRIETVF
ncbi:MAG: hypothetical protein AAGI25_18245 [Bacteroidota bacterium]